MPTLDNALRACYSALEAAHRRMQDVREGRQIGPTEWDALSKIHNAALQEASEALEQFDSTKFCSPNPLLIKRWIRSGEMVTNDPRIEPPEDTDDLYNTAARLMEKSCSHEILGEVLFEADDGRFYTMAVEAFLDEADPHWVRDVSEEEDEETV